MIKGITPAYLSSLVPDTVGNSTNYNLRRANDLQGIACRTSMYKNSFIPSVVDDWNALPDDIRNLDSLQPLRHILTGTNLYLISFILLVKENIKLSTLDCVIKVVL